MAGLLDIFGTGGQDTMGLLGMSPADIQRNRDDAQAQALYALAGRLFQGGRGGASIVEGLQQGQQAYKQAMQGGMQQQLQNYQLQELLKKKQLEEQQRKEELMARQLFMRGYQPAVAGKESMPIEEDGRFIGDSQAIAARPARFDIGSIAPELMAIGPAGQAKLKTGLELQKSMAGETFKLGEGEKQYQRNALTGEITEVAAGAKKRETVTIGNVILDKNTMEVLYTAPDAPAGSIKEFQDFSKLTPAEKASYLQLQEQKRPTTNINIPSEGERKAATLASRLNFSVGQMNQAIGLDPKAAAPNTAAEIARFLTRSEFLPNVLNSQQRQIVEAGQEDVLDAALTLGTGAAYSREQLAGYRKSFFPQMGDTPETVKSKQARLNNLLRSAEVASGRAAGQITAPIPKLPNVATDANLPSQSAIEAEIERRRKAGGG